MIFKRIFKVKSNGTLFDKIEKITEEEGNAFNMIYKAKEVLNQANKSLEIAREEAYRNIEELTTQVENLRHKINVITLRCDTVDEKIRMNNALQKELEKFIQ
ncbi:hypothetical protein B7C51_24780 (plasmid) [Paenibacillus larvae subsp. pulvifaciens]|uniref:Uncharacterized protein n=1 Tax=Paenibacillus larvae subsp. pulvifaciens TaxID=1477 RepID=A0A1V0UZN1_9BACL|nr:hypothetical protein [Paenibacillus larvae]ARF70692.1 hypothetical protein B7C51_24780 [Paenibacillus larvae subsp. pulvifaciens]